MLRKFVKYSLYVKKTPVFSNVVHRTKRSIPVYMLFYGKSTDTDIDLSIFDNGNTPRFQYVVMGTLSCD